MGFHIIRFLLLAIVWGQAQETCEETLIRAREEFSNQKNRFFKLEHGGGRMR